MSDLLKPPTLGGNPVAAVNALRDYIWDVYQAVDLALDNAANQITAVSPLQLDPETLELALAQVGAVTGNGLVWNGSSWAAGGNQWFSVRSSNPQVTTTVLSTISTWLTPDITDNSVFSFDSTTGILTFNAAGQYLVSAGVSAESAVNPTQLEVQGELFTGGDTGSWASITGAEGYAFSLDSTQDKQQAIIPELCVVVSAGDRFRLQMRHDGQATSILSCVLTVKKRY